LRAAARCAGSAAIIHNPMKHGLVSRAVDWPRSIFHRWAADGVYPEDRAPEVLPRIALRTGTDMRRNTLRYCALRAAPNSWAPDSDVQLPEQVVGILRAPHVAAELPRIAGRPTQMSSCPNRSSASFRPLTSRRNCPE
jgi:hypothetical protein